MRRHVGDLIVVYLISIVIEPQVVPELMREDRATTAVSREAENASYADGSAARVGLVDDQVHEVGPRLVAQGMNPVHAAVIGVPESDEIETRFARLGI